MNQAKVQDICEEIVDNVEGALGCALVDLGTGLPLALDVKPQSPVNAAAMELMSAAGVTYFRAYGRKPVETGAHPHGGNAVEEIQATTAETYHFMSLVPGQDQQLLILISERESSNLALGWVAMRQALDMIQKVGANGTDAPARPPEDVSLASHRSPQPPREPTSSFPNRRTHSRRTIWGQR
ncbi:MAG: hypothetical protein OXU72_04540 [Gammaproteobacteria bacterium]|nr:hypothetical protein [Gammaproteobacteria bacterium]